MKKCPKCGADLSDDSKFCSYCGQKMEAEAVTSPPIVEEDETPDSSQSEPINVTAPESNTPKSLVDKIKEKATAQWSKLSVYGKVTTVFITVFVLLCLVAFLFGNTTAGIVAILQIVLTVLAVLMKKQVIKAPKSWLHFVALALAVVLLFPYVSLFGANRNVPEDAENFSWADIVLGTVIPEPESNLGEIIGNTNESLFIYVYRTSAVEYSEYVDVCKEKGFTVEADQSEISYSAYNADGYELSLFYDESKEVMDISVDAAEQYGTLVWPESGIASMLPIPASTTGEITRDDEQGFQAYVSNMPIDEFKAYTTECSDVGFNIDAFDSDSSYSAGNSEGYKLSVAYQGNGVISISIDEPVYSVSVEIECVENWIFSTYDVDVYIADTLEGTIDHGATETYTVALTRGTYEIKFVSAEDDEVTGTVAIDVHQDEALKYKISCSSTGIDVETIVGTIPEYGEDEAPIPQSAVDYKYENYADVQQELETAGFTNITFEILYDIELGWTDEGEVDSVSVNGNTEFEKNDIFKKDAPIVITYHMNAEDDPNKSAEPEPTEQPEETEPPVANLTAENCPDLANLLALRDPSDPSVAAFASEYSGRVIEFDGCVINMQNHESFTTRWDVLLGAGDFDPNSMRGPNFRLTDVNFSEMNVTGGDSVYAGLNVHIVAEVGQYNTNTTLFELDIISMEIRD